MGRLSNAMQSGPAVTCMKTLLMVFNFLFWISGIAILALGVWMKVQLYIYMELTTIYYNEAPYVLMGVGGGIVLIGSLGCLCTAKGSSPFLYVFAAFLVVVFVAELSVGISGFAYRGQLEDGFSKGLDEALQKYAEDKEKKDAVDGIQQGLKCCGSTDYKDWFKVAWDGQGPTHGVPGSCCLNVENCKHNPLPSNGTAEIYTEGCFVKVTTFMEANFGIIGGVAIGFAFLQFFGALLACCLAKNINKSKYEQVA